MAAAWPLAARALDQPHKFVQIGVLSLNTPAGHARNPRFRAFYRTMRELSWIDGVNIAYDQRYAEGQIDRLPQLARELVAAAPDVIVTASTPPALAAKAATSTIPIVFLDPGDPVATGLVSSLAHPGGNVTGVSSMAPNLAAKRLEILREAVPGVTCVAVLFNAAIPRSEVAVKEMTAAATQLGVKVEPTPFEGGAGFAAAFAAITNAAADGLVVFADPLAHSNQDKIVGFAAERALPALYANREFVDAGGLLSYGPNYPGMFRRGAYYVDRILKGAKPADLPVEQPTRFELVINLKTARALGIDVPATLLARADEVIE